VQSGAAPRVALTSDKAWLGRAPWATTAAACCDVGDKTLPLSDAEGTGTPAGVPHGGDPSASSPPRTDRSPAPTAPCRCGSELDTSATTLRRKLTRLRAEPLPRPANTPVRMDDMREVGSSRISILPDERMGPSASRGAVHTSIKDFAHLAGVGRRWPLQEPFQGSLVL
jgi:hypothetical protein